MRIIKGCRNQLPTPPSLRYPLPTALVFECIQEHYFNFKYDKFCSVNILQNSLSNALQIVGNIKLHEVAPCHFCHCLVRKDMLKIV